MELEPKDTLDIDVDELNRGGFGGKGEAARSGNGEGDAARILSGEWWRDAGTGMRDMHVVQGLRRRQEVLWRCSSCLVHGQRPREETWTPAGLGIAQLGRDAWVQRRLDKSIVPCSPPST